MTLTLLELSDHHLSDAAALVAARCRALQAVIPETPARYTEPETILPLLTNLAQRAPGLVALRNGQLVGFLLGMVLPAFRGKRSIYSPEWANGALLAEADTINQALYARLSARWVADGCVLHALTVLAHDVRGLDGWYRQGFGLNGVDAVRGLEPVAGEQAPVTVRQATSADLALVAAHGLALQRHLASAPIFKALTEPESEAEYAQWLEQPTHVMWLAFDAADRPVGSLGLVPANPDACTLMQDPGTISVMHAYTEPAVRGQGIAAALLDRAIADGRARGYMRCSVDFESQNIPAAAFWRRHFQPVCYSVIRNVDERCVG